MIKMVWNRGDGTGDGITGYKSKAEIQIARLLDREGIAYQYEYPLAVIDRGQVRIWYPDFRLSEYGMIIEYFGMNGDAGYRKRSEHKMEVYQKNGIEGVFLTEESFRGDWPTRIVAQIENVLEMRLGRFHRADRREDPGRNHTCGKMAGARS